MPAVTSDCTARSTCPVETKPRSATPSVRPKDNSRPRSPNRASAPSPNTRRVRSSNSKDRISRPDCRTARAGLRTGCQVVRENDISQIYIAGFSSRQKAGQYLDVVSTGRYLLLPYTGVDARQELVPQQCERALRNTDRPRFVGPGSLEVLLENSATPIPAGSVVV